MQNPLMADQVSLSLVIPTYNRGDLIGETLHSAFNQTMPFAEIIVVDDGSTDDTEKVLLDYLDRIKVIRIPNSGVQAARNKGVAAAQSKYVTLCDSDDIFEPDFVTSVVTWLSAHPSCDILYSNFVTFDEHSTHPDKFSVASAEFFEGGKKDNEFVSDIPDLYVRTVAFQPLYPTGSTFQKSFFERIGGYNPAFNRVGAEDWEFTLRAISNGNVAVCTRPLTRIRRHAGNDSADAMRMLIGEVKILEYALKHHPLAAKYEDIIVKGINSRRIHEFNAAFARGDFKTASALLPLLKPIPRDVKFQIKNLILLLPVGLKQAAWWISQQ
jgi:glycosyltransferase involved in cell wall biosynthesis